MGKTENQIRLMLVDDTSLVRAGLRGILNAAPNITVVGEAQDAATAELASSALNPDVALVECNMQSCNGMEVTRRIKHTSPVTRILILSSTGDERMLAQVFRSGAIGLTLKTDSCERLVSDITRVYEGKYAIPDALLKEIVEEFLSHREPQTTRLMSLLTMRELEVLRHMSTGASNKEISEALRISPHTVQNHVVRILKKLNLDNRSQATAYAVRYNHTMLQ